MNKLTKELQDGITKLENEANAIDNKIAEQSIITLEDKKAKKVVDTLVKAYNERKEAIAKQIETMKSEDYMEYAELLEGKIELLVADSKNKEANKLIAKLNDLKEKSANEFDITVELIPLLELTEEEVKEDELTEEELAQIAEENSLDSTEVVVEEKKSVAGKVALGVAGLALIGLVLFGGKDIVNGIKAKINRGSNKSNTEAPVTPTAEPTKVAEQSNAEPTKTPVEEVAEPTAAPVEEVDPNRFDDINNEEQLNNRVDMLVNKYYVDNNLLPESEAEQEALKKELREEVLTLNAGLVEDSSFVGIVDRGNNTIRMLESLYFKGSIKEFNEADFLLDNALGKSNLEKIINARNSLINLNREVIAGQLELDKLINNGEAAIEHGADLNQMALDMTNLRDAQKEAAIAYLTLTHKTLVGEDGYSIHYGEPGTQWLTYQVISGANGGVEFPEDVKDPKYHDFKEFYITNVDGTVTLVNIDKELDELEDKRCTKTIEVEVEMNGERFTAPMPATPQNTIIVNLQRQLETIQKQHEVAAIRSKAIKAVDEAEKALEEDNFTRRLSLR